MAKVSAVQRNRKRQKMWLQARRKREALKATIMNKSIDAETRFGAQIKLASLPRNSAKVRQRNRCSQTGRPRGFYRKFGISRVALREMGSWGLIPGLTKSSW